MKKNIIIAVLLVISVLSILFAFVERTVAKANEALAVKAVQQAEQAREQGEQARAMAIQQKARTERAMTELMNATTALEREKARH
jgi:hypothetical protein